MPNPIPSPGDIGDVIEVASMKGFLVIVGVGIVAGIGLAISDFYIKPRVLQWKMQAMAAAS